MVAEFDNFAVVVGELCEGIAEMLQFVVELVLGLRHSVEIVVDFDSIAEDARGACGFACEIAHAVHGDAEDPRFELSLFAILTSSEFGAQGREDALCDVLGDMCVAAAALSHSEDAGCV